MNKKILSIFLIICMILSLSACKNSTEEKKTKEKQASESVSEKEEKPRENVDPSQAGKDNNKKEVIARLSALNGPTAMSLVKLMEDAKEEKSANKYSFSEFTTDPASIIAGLTKNDLDLAAIPSNAAATIYNKTKGGIKVLATVNTGVLNIVERGDSVKSLKDLKGKKLYATGQGTVPEYTLKYLLKKEGLDPEKDLTIQWAADTTEALSYINKDKKAIAMLPQPFVTAAMTKLKDLRIALNLNDVWEKENEKASIITGVIVARKDFVDANPEFVEEFLKDYKASIQYTKTNPKEAAKLVVKYGILPKEPLAQKALPACNLKYLDGKEMKDTVQAYLSILHRENPKSVGGLLPGDDFYYEK